MSLAVCFWVFWLIGLVLGVTWTRTNRDYYALGNSALVWFLLFLLGWKVFGFPITG